MTFDFVFSIFFVAMLGMPLLFVIFEALVGLRELRWHRELERSRREAKSLPSVSDRLAVYRGTLRK